MPIRALVLLVSLATFLAFVGGGCSPTQTRTFDVTVRNQTPGPLTLSLAKDGPPYEPAWATPEDVATESPRLREDWRRTQGGMKAVPPGRVADVRGLTGKFESGTHAYIRVYAGELSISEMLSKSRGSPDRVDVPLQPGANEITIVIEGTHLKAQVNQPAPQP
jgi:hypothetical protein